MTVDKQDVHNPVTAYLSSLMWDGTPRIERWLIDNADTVRLRLGHNNRAKK